jgi:hypothetical protein
MSFTHLKELLLNAQGVSLQQANAISRLLRNNCHNNPLDSILEVQGIPINFTQILEKLGFDL